MTDGLQAAEAEARRVFKEWADRNDPMNPDMFWDNLPPAALAVITEPFERDSTVRG